jgi:type IV pilus assembly protein PilZ
MADAQEALKPRDLRAPLQLRVDYSRMNTFFADYTKNISKGGTFIRTPTPLPVGTQFQFQLGVPGFPTAVQLNGEVTWNLSPEDAARAHSDAGMGVRFIFESAASQQKFERAVEKLMKDSLGEDIFKQLLGKAS